MFVFEAVYHYSKSLHVLYVEDNLDVQKDTTQILKNYFSSIDTAIDGQDGLEKYEAYYAVHQTYYDIVISDIMMPNLDGIEMSSTILKINRDQMIVILSAYSESEYLYSLINLGISHFLYKPIELDRLNRTFYSASQVVYNRKNELLMRQKEAEERVFLQAVMDLQENMIVISDGAMIEAANQALLDYFNLENMEKVRETLGCICSAFMEGEGYFYLDLLKDDISWIAYMNRHKEEDFVVMMRNAQTKEIESFKVQVNYFPINKKYIATFTNITKLFLQQKKYQQRAMYDNLTGIHNRFAFYDYIEEFFVSTDRLTELTLLMFDIDYFKQVNDLHGHLVGDEILKEVASVIQLHIRREDIFARWGGDEFIIAFSGYPKEQIKEKVECLCQKIAQYSFQTIGSLSCSFGVGGYREKDTLIDMIGRADEALYQAKKSGRDQVCIL